MANELRERIEADAADRYASRQLARMDASAQQRAVGTVTVPPFGPPVPNIPYNYGAAGAGSWSAGMVWNGLGSSFTMSNDLAMRVSAVYGCWRILSDAVGTLPLDTFTAEDGTRVPYPRPDYLSFQLPAISRIAYLCQLVLSLCTDGNAFVATPRDDLGDPVALVPLQPELITILVVDGRKVFECQGDRYSELDIMHIPGMMLAGHLRGVSPIAAARDHIDAALKAQDYGRTFIGNAAMPPAVIEVPNAGGDPVQERTRARTIAETWAETHGGSANAGKVGVLTGGAKLTTVALSPEDAQWLDSRRFGVSEIARFYGVPPHLLADASNSTSWGSGLAEQNLAFGQLSLRPLVERIEEAHTRLLTTHGLRNVFIKLNLDALLRASLTDRYASYVEGIGAGFLTINEARRYEDLPPVPWGDDPPAPTPAPFGGPPPVAPEPAAAPEPVPA